MSAPPAYSLRRAVFADCSKLLAPQYKWLTYRHQLPPYPEFALPADPTEDIARALIWRSTVKAESKGEDGGEDYYAAQFKDEGSKVYSVNVNVLHSLVQTQKPPPASVDDAKLAMERWRALDAACHECRIMMKMLHLNRD